MTTIALVLAMIVMSGPNRLIQQAGSATQAPASASDTTLVQECADLLRRAARASTPEERIAVLNGSSPAVELVRLAFAPHPTHEELSRLAPIAEALWVYAPNHLVLNASKDGLCWWDIPRNLVLECCNAEFPVTEDGSFKIRSGMAPMFVGEGGKPVGTTKKYRHAMLARTILLPLVQDKTIHIVGKGPEWRLDRSQWFTKSPETSVEKETIHEFIGMAYDPFHFTASWPGVDEKHNVVLSHPKRNGSRPLAGVVVDGLSYCALLPTYKAATQIISELMYSELTEMIIPAGHAAADGSFVPPTDSEFVKYCVTQYGPHFETEEPAEVKPGYKRAK